jgi:hypothetical protein
VPMAVSLAQDPKGKPAGSGITADETAIKQVVADFSDGWNIHDARALCATPKPRKDLRTAGICGSKKLPVISK